MIGNQRWLFREDRYRPPAETIRTQDYEVAELAEGAAKDFVQTHHYSSSYPAAKERFGIFRHGQLSGVAVFSVPQRKEVFKPLPSPFDTNVDLGRFVLLDEVPGNGETWFLGRCFELLRGQGYRGVVSFSDPVPRTTSEGRKIFPGHVGTIYQAHNAVCVGRSKARWLYVLPNGCVMPPRAISKILASDQGEGYSAGILERFGATPIAGEEPKVWLDYWLAKLCRRMHHPGNWKYAWGLNRPDRRQLDRAPSLSYPKKSGMTPPARLW